MESAQGRKAFDHEKERQAAIRALLKEQAIQTQDELATALRKWFQVTQATVSRDMKEMHLIKCAFRSGGYRYGEPETGWNGLDDRLIRLCGTVSFQRGSSGADYGVKTMSGAATRPRKPWTAGSAGDVGSIAGDNTIFLAARDHASAVKGRRADSDMLLIK